jgi:serine/threonine protein kinase
VSSQVLGTRNLEDLRCDSHDTDCFRACRYPNMVDASSPFEDLREVIISRLIKLFRPNKDDDGRFIPFGATRAVFHKDILRDIYHCIGPLLKDLDLDTNTFVARIKLRELHNFLAILVYSRCGQRDFKTFVVKFVAPANGISRELPLSYSEIKDIFNSEATAHAFKNSQSFFCPVVLQKNKEVVCEKPRPLPYISKKPLGEGSFGKVYAVEIAAGHWADGHMLNSGDMLVACKEYKFVPASGDTSHEQERAVMLEILRTPLKHDNILESFGSLRMEDTYSLFMPLADCDLWDWMTEKSPAVPKTMTHKAEIVGYAASLASGLAFLHDGLVTHNLDPQSCFHMDLKPRNVLVVTDENTGKVRWKLSDFNMSRVKARSRSTAIIEPQLRRTRTFSDTVQVFNVSSLFREANPTEPSRADSTINRRGDGTYIAPEASIDFGGKVGAHSDTWSLGCILAVVLSYLDGGAASVLQFSDRRCENAEDDRFFSQTAPKNAHKPPRLNEAVNKWLKELCMSARKRDQDAKLVRISERNTVKLMTTFLKDKVLVIDPNKRTKAEQVYHELKQALHSYMELQDEIDKLRVVVLEPKSPKKRRFFHGLSLPRRDVPAQFDSAPKSGEGYRYLNLGLEPGARSCHFSPNAEALAYVYDDELKVYSITEIGQTQDADALIDLGESKPKHGSWGSIALSKRHIIATTNRFMFEVSDSHNKSMVQKVEIKA